MSRVVSDERIPSREMCANIIGRIIRFCTGEGSVEVDISGWWNGELQWVRNRVWVATDRRDVQIRIIRSIRGGVGRVIANQVDDESLHAAVSAAERIALRTEQWQSPEFLPDPPELPSSTSIVWSDATYGVTADERGALARTLMQGAERAGLVSAGYLEMRGGVSASAGQSSGISTWDLAQRRLSVLRTQDSIPLTYDVFTQAQCSMTVRHPQGRGSGWAGLSGYDWAAIDGPQLANRALEKCIASIDAVRIEPGRYTVILEPQAVSNLLENMMISFGRMGTESGRGPWSLSFDEGLHLWRSKLGLKVVDERVTISHDPNDPELGVLRSKGMTALTLIERGVLRSLEFARELYGLPKLNVANSMYHRPAFRMSGGTTSIESMVQTTERGLLITRFSSILTLDERSLLSTGVTRDGMWLVEKGKLTKSVQNMRFTESPLFVLNQIEELGIPAPVFRPVQDPYRMELRPAIVPPLRASDFSFTSLSDAV